MTRPKATYFADGAAFRGWLAEHHASATECLVGFYKRGTGKPSMTWPESVDQALCYGWIDGVRRSAGAGAYTIRFTPRKPRSIWSAKNVARVAELAAEGLMAPAGLAAAAARTPERTGVYSFERKAAAVLSAEQEQQLRANAQAAAFWDAQPPGYRATATHWVISAKQEETRQRRLAQLIADAAAGLRIKELRRWTPAATEKKKKTKRPSQEVSKNRFEEPGASSRERRPRPRPNAAHLTRFLDEDVVGTLRS